MEIESGGNWARVSLSGEIDMHWVETHQEQIDRLCDGQLAHVVLDLEAVTFMDSTGFGLIARLCHNCRAKDGFVYILRPSETVLKAMEIVGLTQVSNVVIADTPAKVAHVDQHFATFEAVNPSGLRSGLRLLRPPQDVARPPSVYPARSAGKQCRDHSLERPGGPTRGLQPPVRPRPPPRSGPNRICLDRTPPDGSSVGKARKFLPVTGLLGSQ